MEAIQQPDSTTYRKLISNLPSCQIVMMAYLLVFAVTLSDAEHNKRLKKMEDIDTNYDLRKVVELIISWTPKDNIAVYCQVVRSFAKVEPRIVNTMEDTVIHPCEICQVLLKNTKEKPACMIDNDKYRWFLC
jgi:hypothetical protein